MELLYHSLESLSPALQYPVDSSCGEMKPLLLALANDREQPRVGGNTWRTLKQPGI